MIKPWSGSRGKVLQSTTKTMSRALVPAGTSEPGPVWRVTRQAEQLITSLSESTLLKV